MIFESETEDKLAWVRSSAYLIKVLISLFSKYANICTKLGIKQTSPCSGTENT